MSEAMEDSSMRVLVISDTHIPTRLSALDERLVGRIKRADVVIHCGDFVNDDTYFYIESMAKEFFGVLGNMDHDTLSFLPVKRVLEFENVKIGVIHGWGDPFTLPRRVMAEFGDDVDVVLFGHSHFPMCERRKGIFLLNPGSVSGNIPPHRPSIGLLKITGRDVIGEIIYKPDW